MDENSGSIFLTSFGAVVAAAGLIIFAVRTHDGPQNVMRLWKLEFQVSHPGLVVFLAGCLMVAFPFSPWWGSPGPSKGFFQANEVEAIESSDGPTSYDEYVTVQDETGSIQVELPAKWRDVRTEFLPFAGDGGSPLIVAAPDVDLFYEDVTAPGIWFGATDDLILGPNEYERLLDLPVHDHRNECDYEGRFDFENERYTGRYDKYVNCGGTNSAVFTLVAYPEDREYLILVQLQAGSEADLQAVDKALATFEVLNL